MPRRPSAAGLRRLGLLALLAAALAAPAANAAQECPVPAPPPPAESDTSRLDEQTWAQEAAQTLPPARKLDPQRVAAILATIEPPRPQAASWWERFVQWLERYARQNEGSNWLADLLRDVEPWVFTNIFLAILAMLVIALGALIIVELRAAGVGKARRRQTVAGARPAAASPRVELGLADIAALPLREQPPALLQWAIARLVERQVLPADASLTNGELLAVLRARAPDELPTFRRLTRVAEAAAYGAIEPAEDDARELLAALRAPAPVAG